MSNVTPTAETCVGDGTLSGNTTSDFDANTTCGTATLTMRNDTTTHDIMFVVRISRQPGGQCSHVADPVVVEAGGADATFTIPTLKSTPAFSGLGDHVPPSTQSTTTPTDPGQDINPYYIYSTTQRVAYVQVMYAVGARQGELANLSANMTSHAADMYDYLSTAGANSTNAVIPSTIGSSMFVISGCNGVSPDDIVHVGGGGTIQLPGPNPTTSNNSTFELQVVSHAAPKNASGGTHQLSIGLFTKDPDVVLGLAENQRIDVINHNYRAALWGMGALVMILAGTCLGLLFYIRKMYNLHPKVLEKGREQMMDKAASAQYRRFGTLDDIKRNLTNVHSIRSRPTAVAEMDALEIGKQ